MQQTILIIGATSGLGLKLTELYCMDGYKVAAAGRRIEGLKDLKLKYSENLNVFQLDIRKYDLESSFKLIIEHLGGIDLLILSASIVDFNKDLIWENEKYLFETNIIGYSFIINLAYHYFLQKGRGHIVGITSIAAARGNITTPAYNASKAFQSSYLESLKLRSIAEKNNVIITELIPGYINTSMAKGERLFWVADVSKAAAQAKSAIEKRKQKAYITKRWFFIYHLYKFIPSIIYNYIITSKIKLKTRH